MRNYDVMETAQLEDLAKKYRDFLDTGKTERECAENICRIAEGQGFRNLETLIEAGETLRPGDKIYALNRKKAVILMEIGEEPLSKGMLIIGSHIDSPRLDLKQRPLYEKEGLAYLDTHYYGGIKKYQWVASPLSLHGTVVKKDGSCVKISIGEDPKDPVLGITDLLVHLASKQQDKKGFFVVEGEALDLLAGSRPLFSGDEEPKEHSVKDYICQLLKERYDIEEQDLISAELEAVPAGHAREFGLDSSMIMAYGQDDRSCAFCSLTAFLRAQNPVKTKVCMFVDKEEIGSMGATGMESRFFENTVAEVMELLGQYSDLGLRRTLRNSCMLSGDVSAAYDPTYKEVFEKNNASFLGKGPAISKYTGSRGKSGSNDARAEYLAKLRNAFESRKLSYQTAEIGKVDAGGGGTIAYIPAAYGMDVVDMGVPVLNMHAPYEISSKADIYETCRCYQAFYEM